MAILEGTAAPDVPVFIMDTTALWSVIVQLKIVIMLMVVQIVQVWALSLFL